MRARRHVASKFRADKSPAPGLVRELPGFPETARSNQVCIHRRETLKGQFADSAVRPARAYHRDSGRRAVADSIRLREQMADAIALTRAISVVHFDN
jgi:hypothetical protein